jgi:hypothetical protein
MASKQTHKKLHYVIPEILDKIITTNQTTGKKHTNSVFDHTVTGYSVKDFLKRIIKYTKACRNTIIYALCLIDMLCIKDEVVMTGKNIYCILMTAVLISVKMNEDCHYKDEDYAWIGKIEKTHLAQAEAKFLSYLDYQIFIKREHFLMYEEALN